jgi:hypothetical protein
MDTGTLVAIVISLLMSLFCCGIGVFMFVLLLGFMLLRRRGKKKITMKQAVSAGAERVSQVFVRGKGGLQAADDDDDDD